MNFPSPVIVLISATHLLLHSNAFETNNTGKYYCYLTSSKYPINCTDSREGVREGVDVILYNKLRVPVDSICNFNHGNVTTSQRCLKNGLFYTVAIERKKRQTFSTVGSTIGTIVGGPLGTVVGGLVGGLIDAFAGLFNKPNQPPPNNPPSIVCPKLGNTFIAGKGERQAKVDWTEPTARDNEDGSITQKIKTSPSNYKPGDKFNEGSHALYFSVTDNGNLPASCGIQFLVKVIKCPQLEWPKNGKLSCNDAIYGSTCTVKCNTGYELSSQSTLECTEQGRWSSSFTPDCSAKKCNSPWPKIKYGIIACPSNVATFDMTCYVDCNDGFTVEGSPLIGCDEDGNWWKAGTCKDISPPRFDESSCPKDKDTYIDSENNTAAIQWDIPVGSDNSGLVPKITERHNYRPGQRFEAGTHYVQYRIEDQAGNIGESCFFGVRVKTLKCSPPAIVNKGSEHMVYDCPNFYRFKAVCSITCRSGYPHGGAKHIQCMNEGDTYPPKPTWQWDKASELKPFCKVLPCPDLPAPENGALACSLWEHGNMCQMQCEDGYDTPVLPYGLLFVCGQSTGKWRPEYAKVPDCVRKTDANQMNVRSHLYYYTGKCNSSKENIKQIQDNFIQALNTSQFTEFCVGKFECQSKFVNVTCGFIPSRVSKRAKDHIFKRQTSGRFGYTVEFDLIIPFQKTNTSSPTETFFAGEQILYSLSDSIRTEVDSGHFDLPLSDISLDRNSFDAGQPKLLCPEGLMPRQDSGICVGCQTGQYYSSVTDDCQNCSFGTYQDMDGSTTCLPCPENTNTSHIGANNSSQCLEYCPPGFFSTTGLAPCQACPSSTYQPDYSKTFCIQCIAGHTTLKDGSKAVSDCQVFDIAIDNNSPATLVFDKNEESVTLFFWIRLGQLNSTDPVLQINSAGENYIMKIQNGKNISIDINEQISVFDGCIKRMTWTAVAVTSSDKLIRLYIDGVLLDATQNSHSARYLSILKGYVLTFSADSSISGFHMLNRSLSLSEIKTVSLSCFPNIDGYIYTMNTFLDEASTKIVVPSRCDAIDECRNHPCGNHTCVNLIGHYKCICVDGYTGNNCEVPPNYCANNECRNNASCVNGRRNYTCDCLDRFSGSVCEIEATDGAWSEWTAWDSCTETCGGGYKTRIRRCDSPPPDPTGRYCLGTENDTRSCNERKCPECISPPESFGVVLTCNETEASKRCTISCSPGLFFVNTPLPYYECGLVTNYTWNHQSKDNPTARFPACSEIKTPNDLTLSFDGNFESIPCTEENKKAVANTMKRNVEQRVQCAKTGTCLTNVVTGTCQESDKSPNDQDSDGLLVSVQLKSVVEKNGTGYNLKDVFNNKSEPSSDLVSFVNLILDLGNSAIEVMNDSKEIFSVSINGKNHTIADEENGLRVSSQLSCPEGSVRLDAFCGDCPMGSYSDGETAIMCPIGQYQDTEGQSSCNICPPGYTTLGRGSVNITECSVKIKAIIDEKISQKQDQSIVGIAAGVGAAGGCLIVTAIIVIIYRTFRKRRRYDPRKTDAELSSCKYHVVNKSESEQTT